MRAVSVLFEVKPGKGQTESRSLTCLAPCNFLLIDALLFKSADCLQPTTLKRLLEIRGKQTSLWLSKCRCGNSMY